MWECRTKSLNALENSLKDNGLIIYEGFKIIDELINKFEALSNQNLFPEVCGIILLKGKKYCLSLFTSLLDGFGQEAGALLRPSIECYELFTYIRTDPNRINEIIEDKLPSAGERAKIIGGQFKEIRDYLNSNASHFSFSGDSIRHLYDLEKDSFRKKQEFNEDVFVRNLKIIYSLQVMLIHESFESLKIIHDLPKELHKNISDWNKKGNEIFIL